MQCTVIAVTPNQIQVSCCEEVSSMSLEYCRGFTRLHKARWLREEEGWSLSPSSLRDITDRIALTNGHLSASVTQWRIERSETRLWPETG